MNAGCVLLVLSNIHRVAERFCGGEWEIRIFPLAGLLNFRLDWHRVNGEFMNHYALSISEVWSMDDARFSVQKMERDIEEHYSQEVIIYEGDSDSI